MEAGRNRRIFLTIVGCLLAVFVAITYYSYRQGIDSARTRVASGSKVVNTPFGLIEYADVGKGSPVLVVHGAGGGFDQGLEIAEPLIDQGFRVIAVSRFGYLRTPLPTDASPTAQADAHAALLDELKVERVAVIGASAGAPSAMQLCLRHAERCSALVLLFPLAFAPRPAGIETPKPSPLQLFMMKATLHSDFMFWAATKVARNTLIKTVLGTPVEDFRSAPVEEQARALRVMKQILPVSEREKGIWNDAAIGASIPRYDLERIHVPTLLISAEDDLYRTFPSSRYTAEHIPGARLVDFPTGGHLLLGHWKEASARVADFLSRQTVNGHSVSE